MSKKKKFILTNENYYNEDSNKLFLSNSQIKDFMKCEAYAMAKIEGKWEEKPSEAMLIGSYVDSWFEGTLEEFKERNPEIFKKDGTLKSGFIKAEQIIERVKQDDLFMKCMSGKKQVIMIGKLYDAPIKIKMDSYIPKQAIVDLKVVKDIRDVSYSNGAKQTFIEKSGYDTQLAIYQEIVKQNTGLMLDCIIAGVDKKEYSDLDCILIPNDQLLFKLEQLANIIPRILAIKNYIEQPHRCGVCDYCRATKKLERLILPSELIER